MKEPTEADLLAEATKKARKARAWCRRPMLEETLGKVKSMISRQRQATASGWLAALEKVLAPAKSKPLQEHRPGSDEGAA